MNGKFVLLAQLATFLAQIEAIIDALTGGDIKYTNAALNNGQETTVTAALNALFTDLATKASARTSLRCRVTLKHFSRW